MSSYTSIPDTACANVQGFSAKGTQRDLGHIALDGADIVRLVAAHNPADSVRVHAPSDFTNAMKTELELERWAEVPDTYFGYYDFPNHSGAGRPYRDTFYPSNTAAKVTTWTGAKLGDIITAHVYRHNFGSRMVSLRMRGTNGAYYSGRASWDNGSCINLRKLAPKGKRR